MGIRFGLNRFAQAWWARLVMDCTIAVGKNMATVTVEMVCATVEKVMQDLTAWIVHHHTTTTAHCAIQEFFVQKTAASVVSATTSPEHASAMHFELDLTAHK